MGEKILLKGNEVIAEAAIIAGCRYFFGYPITPQNEIPAYMARRLPQVDGTFVQAESEVAAINMVFGASAAGARVMTSSSSPGISLKQEGISYMACAQLPAVVVNMMRGGPGLGNIAGSQGDYFQATKGGGHGDYHNIVLAPNSVQELADLTLLAFDLADQYRIVSMILGDGFLGQMSEGVVLPKPTGKEFDKSSWALTGASGREQHIVRSLYLKPEDGLEKINIQLQNKYQQIEANEIRYAEQNIEGADFLLVAFGLAARLCSGVIRALGKQGVKAGLFRPITLWPFPGPALKKRARQVKKVLVVELNAGQMLEDVRLAVDRDVEVDFIGRMGGMVPILDKIINRIKQYAA